MKPLEATPLHPQWLVLRKQSATLRTVLHWAKGRVIDIGCGDRWLADKIGPACEYLGLDYPPTISQGYHGRPDVMANASRLPLRDSVADTILLLDVLEHLRYPDSALGEAARVVKTGGLIILQVPFMYPLHDAPHDFTRWTIDGLRQLISQHNLHIVEEASYGRPVETAAAMGAIALARNAIDAIMERRIAMLLIPIISLLVPVINILGLLLATTLPANSFMPLGYRIVVEKPG